MYSDRKCKLDSGRQRKTSKTYSISHELLRPSQFLEKFLEILEWSILQK